MTRVKVFENDRQVVPEQVVSTGGPIEVGGKDVRSLLIPGIDCTNSLMTEAQLDSVMEAAARESAENAAKKPRSSLEVAIERHRHLTPAIEAFCSRLESWETTVHEYGLRDVLVGLRSEWGQLGIVLELMAKDGAVPRTTPKSRMRVWLKPGAKVGLRPDIDEEYGAIYSPEELNNLEVVAVLEHKVFLKTGERDVGLVPLAHVRKP
jgi:hypothetical protein